MNKVTTALFNDILQQWKQSELIGTLGGVDLIPQDPIGQNENSNSPVLTEETIQAISKANQGLNFDTEEGGIE